jgi:hypothetical protein
MLFKLVETIEFPHTDCEDIAQAVSIIVKALHNCGVVKDGDKVHFNTDQLTVKVYIYRPQGVKHGH